MRGLRLLAVLLTLLVGGGAAIALAAGHRPSRSSHPSHHAAKPGPRHCYARRHGRRVRVRCPKPKHRSTATQHTATTTTQRVPTPPVGSTTTTVTSASTSTSTAAVDYCTQYGLPRSTEVDESDQGSGAYLLAPACAHLASGGDAFNVYNFDSQTHTFMVRDGAGQPQTLTFAGGHTGVTLSLGPAPAGGSTSATATVSLLPGTYTLVCTLHPGMQATISVG